MADMEMERYNDSKLSKSRIEDRTDGSPQATNRSHHPVPSMASSLVLDSEPVSLPSKYLESSQGTNSC